MQSATLVRPKAHSARPVGLKVCHSAHRCHSAQLQGQLRIGCQAQVSIIFFLQHHPSHSPGHLYHGRFVCHIQVQRQQRRVCRCQASLSSNGAAAAKPAYPPSAKGTLVARLLACKEASGKTFSQIAEEVGLTNVYCAQLFYNQVRGVRTGDAQGQRARLTWQMVGVLFGRKSWALSVLGGGECWCCQ